MVSASKKFVCILLDCQWGAAHGDLVKRYKVQGFPTVVYTDSDGEELGRMGDRSPASVARELASFSQ